MTVVSDQKAIGQTGDGVANPGVKGKRNPILNGQPTGKCRLLIPTFTAQSPEAPDWSPI